MKSSKIILLNWILCLKVFQKKKIRNNIFWKKMNLLVINLSMIFFLLKKKIFLLQHFITILIKLMMKQLKFGIAINNLNYYLTIPNYYPNSYLTQIHQKKTIKLKNNLLNINFHYLILLISIHNALIFLQFIVLYQMLLKSFNLMSTWKVLFY